MSEAERKIWTSHIHADAENLPWVNAGVPGMDTRVLHYREDEQMCVTQVRAAPFTVSGKHIHLGPAHAYTLAGCWGHDHTYEYVKGTYVFEPVGVVHQFLSGADPVDAVFMSFGDSQFYDDEAGEPTGSFAAGARVAWYLEKCEALGLPRPNILRV